jgi:hypothetical protein
MHLAITPILQYSIPPIRVVLATLAAGSATIAYAAEFGADQVTKFQVPLTPPAKATIEASGNKHVTAAIGTVYLPPGFSAARTWPVMIVSATSDFNQRSGPELERYVPAARKLGWMLIAADAPVTPRNDSNELRYGCVGLAPEQMAETLFLADRLRRILRRREASGHPRRDAAQSEFERTLRTLLRHERGTLQLRS